MVLLICCHYTPHQVENSKVVKEQRRFLTLESVPVMPVTTGQIVAGASTDDEIKAAKFAHQLLQAITVQLLHVGEVDQIPSLVRLLPPTSNNIPVNFRNLNRDNVLEGDTEPMEGHFCTAYSRKEREEVDAIWVHVLQDGEVVCNSVDLE